MNSHHQPSSQVPPAIPIHNGRPMQGPYGPSSPYHHPPPYQGYPYQYPMQYGRPPQQWNPYHVPMQMGRGFQQYPQMTPYPMPQNYQPMRPPLHQVPSSSSLHSHHAMISPSPSDHSFQNTLAAPAASQSPNIAPLTPPPPPAVAAAAPPPSKLVTSEEPPAVPRTASPQRTPFYPPLPWQSFEGDFPTRKLRRKRRPAPQSSSAPVELPRREDTPRDARHESSDPSGLQRPSVPIPSDLETTNDADNSEVLAHLKHDERTAETLGRSLAAPLPIIPAVPNIPSAARASKGGPQGEALESLNSASGLHTEDIGTTQDISGESTKALSPGADDILAPTRTVPKSWADLVRSQVPAVTNVDVSGEGVPAMLANGMNAKGTSLAEALTSYNVKNSKESAKISFLEPRGLINTGNMCYMNSILQVLLFCVPFYTFLDSIGRKASHSFKSDTPMLDALIMFIREFAVIDAAVSVEQLRMRLKDTELEQYGEAFIPEFVYDVIRRLPRFSSMRRGHQQDAEEFLGFLLEELHDECGRTMKQASNRGSSGTSTPTNGILSPISGSTDSLVTEDSGWLEVGPKQRAAITRSSGSITMESPVTKIFGGKLRSELRIPGTKSSVTLEPYQPLQLDIGAPHVSNIIDALKGLTKPETLHGDFNSPRGPGSTATKQVTIETLPQVLILHLKRFQYDNTGGTQKIWKKVGYPLELEIPKEVFPQHKRGGLLAHGGLPKYRLISVVYHHGKNASGGHYTVDVRRQEGREWIRLDDTLIRRIRSEEVAEGGSEEDPKTLAAALEKHKEGQSSGKPSNVYDQIASEGDDPTQVEKPWSQVNGSAPLSAATNKKWSGVANGVVTPNKTSGNMTPVGRSSVKDNKVAYILFYQRVEGTA